MGRNTCTFTCSHGKNPIEITESDGTRHLNFVCMNKRRACDRIFQGGFCQRGHHGIAFTPRGLMTNWRRQKDMFDWERRFNDAFFAP